MKKICIVFALLCATLVVSAQEVPTSFPRKFLMEHFTGETCGYCPKGMYTMVKYLEESNVPHIWVSHHYGYENDDYTISESPKIGKAVGVQGAPNLAINRTKMTGTTIAFQPANLLDIVSTIAKKCDTVAEASVLIDRTYNADTRELTVTVSGQVANTETTEYLLTVLIKENGLIGKQADYESYSFGGGWVEFIHPRVIRDVLSEDAMGDTVLVTNQAYSKTYTYTVNETWVPENCCVVAYITPLAKKPVINAEEAPLVEGTTGGEHYKWPYGITEAVAPTKGKLTFKNLELSKPSDDKLELRLVGEKTKSSKYGNLRMVVTLEFNTPDSILPTDTLMFAETNSLNTFSIGQFDLATQTFSGSRVQYHLDKNMDFIAYSWRINSGKVIMDANGGFAASGKFYMGGNFNITCTLPEETPVENVVFDKAHVEKLMRDGKIVISIDGVEYDLQGRVITQ